MKIQEAEPKIKKLITQYLPGWEFRWDRATSRFGCCHNNLHRITLSRQLVELNSWENIKDTTLHEIAHGLVGHNHGHDVIWQAKCREIGCRPERCYGTSVVTPPKKWLGTCPSCGRTVWHRTRTNISCGKCNKKYDPRYKFEWEVNPEYELYFMAEEK